MKETEADLFLKHIGEAKNHGDALRASITLHYLDGAETIDEYSELVGASEESVGYQIRKLYRENKLTVKLQRRKPKRYVPPHY